MQFGEVNFWPYDITEICTLNDLERVSATDFGEGVVGIYGREHTRFWSSLGHAQANACTGRGRTGLSHTTFVGRTREVFASGHGMPSVTSAPRSADDGAGMRVPGISTCEPCHTGQLQAQISGEAAVCPCATQPSG